MEPTKIDKKFRMKQVVSPLPKKIMFEFERSGAPTSKMATKRRAPEEKTQAPMASEKPKKKFKFIPVSFP